MLPGQCHRGHYLLAPLTGNKEGRKCIMVLRVKPTPTVFIPRWTTHPCILYQVCATRVPCCRLREQVNNVRMVVSPLWRVPGNTHGFFLDGQSYRQGWATVPTSIELVVSSVRISMPTYLLFEHQLDRPILDAAFYSKLDRLPNSRPSPHDKPDSTRTPLMLCVIPANLVFV